MLGLIPFLGRYINGLVSKMTIAACENVVTFISARQAGGTELNKTIFGHK